jgi:hypothetical protein
MLQPRDRGRRYPTPASNFGLSVALLLAYPLYVLTYIHGIGLLYSLRFGHHTYFKWYLTKSKSRLIFQVPLDLY